MKNYEVEAIMRFTDKEAGIKREVGDKFVCAEKRYEFLKANNAVKLISVIEEEELLVTEDEVQAVDIGIIEESVKEKPKKKRATKKK